VRVHIIAFMLTVADLREYIRIHNVPAEILYPPVPTPTVSAAAQAMGVCSDAIIKSVLFTIRRTEPLLVIANGERWIDQRLIADRLGVGKKQVRIANPDQVLAQTGYPVGGVPPFGHLQPLPTWIDPAVLEQDMIYGGGGDDSVLLRMRAADLLSAAAAEVVSVCG
jgi:prolyl-tRNA editing enzyme YbaK/EbsC (Cys-tRNA(Pro) deacylase)